VFSRLSKPLAQSIYAHVGSGACTKKATERARIQHPTYARGQT
jgi:hypothetical protein